MVAGNTGPRSALESWGERRSAEPSGERLRAEVQSSLSLAVASKVSAPGSYPIL